LGFASPSNVQRLLAVWRSIDPKVKESIFADRDKHFGD